MYYVSSLRWMSKDIILFLTISYKVETSIFEMRELEPEKLAGKSGVKLQ